MRYRELDANGDYQLGRFLVNSPAAVAQAVLTRLRLLAGEWFLDTTEGTPYATQALGFNTGSLRDQMVKQRILGTTGVTGIDSYSSTVDIKTRTFNVVCQISTAYGSTSVTATL